MMRRCNLVEVEGDGVASLCEFGCLGRAPLVALYMQPVRVYK
jgi:hypothetical protein